MQTYLYLYNHITMEQTEQPILLQQQFQPLREQQNSQAEELAPSAEHESLADEQVVLINPFKEQYLLTKQKFNSQIRGFSDLTNKIETMMKYREDRTYHLVVNDRADYISSMWMFLQRQMQHESPYIQNNLMQLVTGRHNNVLEDILQNKLQIEVHRIKPYDYQQDQKHKKMSMLRQQSTEIQRKLMDMNEGLNQINKSTQHQTSESRFKAFQINEQKIKEYEQFMRKQKKEKEERNRLIEQLKKKEQQARIKKQQQMKEAKEKILRQRKEELLKKNRQSEEKREKQKQQREQRDRQYKFISKSLAQQPPLFKKLQQNYRYRYDKLQSEKRSKVMSERKSMFVNIDEKALQQHQKRYEQLRSEKERQRRDRMQQYEKMMDMQQQQIHSKYKSNFQLSEYVNLKEEEKKAALEKKQKVKKYIEETVKQRYLPRIDEEKRKEFLKLIEDMKKNKRVKKILKEDGSVSYEEIKPADPRQVGLGYLQMTKQMANKMRSKRKNSDHIPDTQNEKPKIFDYLADRRKKGTSMSNRDRLGFVTRKGLSFDQKCKKVQLQSQKLQQLAKQKQMKLKFGKFSTSDEILQHKEEIDQHYIDIINMKLKLINFKEQ